MFENIFATEKYSLVDLRQLAAESPNLLIWAAPAMLFFVALEYYISHRKNLGLYKKKDLLPSVGVGAIYLVVTYGTKALTFGAVWLVYYHVAPFTFKFTWWSFILCWVVYDFCRYWAHRWAHEYRFWWASHITHHSAEHYNFTVSFRLCWVDQVKIIFFLPVILMGFDPIMFFIIHQLSILFQFTQHTELVPKLHPIIEYFIVTPANHKVHHGKNEEYIDRNYGSFFMIWDRWFGTYQKPGAQPIFGVSQPIKSHNPVYLVFHEYVDIVRDFWQAKGIKQKYKAVFGRPGEYESIEKF